MNIRRPDVWRAMRPVLFHLALAAMVLRALLPDGWMPNSAGLSGGTTLIICTIEGPTKLHVDADGTSHAPQDQTHHHDVCPFAVAGPFAPPTALALAAPTAWISETTPPDTAGFQPINIDTAHRPRGPPHLV
jgi:hypothetical protein